MTGLSDGVLSYSFLPTLLRSVGGVIVALLGSIGALVIFVGKLIGGNPVPGIALQPMLMLVLGGLQLLTLGIVGEHLWRTLAQVRARDP